MKYSGPSGGSQLSGGGIIIFRVIRRHFLAAVVDPAVSLSTTVLFRWKSFLDHVDHAAPRAPRRWMKARPRKGRHGAGEDAAVDAHAKRSTRVHWFGCGVGLPSPQGMAAVGIVGGGEASTAAQPATGGRSMRQDRRCFGQAGA